MSLHCSPLLLILVIHQQPPEYCHPSDRRMLERIHFCGFLLALFVSHACAHSSSHIFVKSHAVPLRRYEKHPLTRKVIENADPSIKLSVDTSTVRGVATNVTVSYWSTETSPKDLDDAWIGLYNSRDVPKVTAPIKWQYANFVRPFPRICLFFHLTLVC